MTSKQHWEGIYQGRDSTQVSWYQPDPRLSFELISRVAPDRSSSIIDVGGGTSLLVDKLIDSSYANVTVLDLSQAALDIAKRRLGPSGSGVHWLAADVLTFQPMQNFDVWHDRAVFHFLTNPADRAKYVRQVRRSVRPGGHVIVATFSDDGPTKCSGLDVMRYDPRSLHGEFGAAFTLLESHREEHVTPNGVTQSFVYCLCSTVPAIGGAA